MLFAARFIGVGRCNGRLLDFPVADERVQDRLDVLHSQRDRGDAHVVDQGDELDIGHERARSTHEWIVGKLPLRFFHALLQQASALFVEHANELRFELMVRIPGATRDRWVRRDFVQHVHLRIVIGYVEARTRTSPPTFFLLA